jgi:ADP-ribosylglycohydrolase
MLKRDFNSFTEAMEWIIKDHPGSDTDTNSSIAGSLLGALYGYNNLDKQTKLNYEQITTQDVTKYLHPRPVKYQPSNMFKLAEKLVDLL